ncbi:MAG: GntR family transcriptional regulator [Planctomycetota bacterium]|nr:MAG: GntR family transcriptional regulator [Planctomycetota bacterium]
MVRFWLDKQSPVPFYRQIVDMVLVGISTGSILPGEKLPTIREAAVNLEVNPNTIAKAYTQLRLMGILDTQQGSGVFVRAQPAVQRTAAEKKLTVDTFCRDFIGRAQMLNISVKELLQHMKQICSKAKNKNNGKYEK